MEYQELVNLRLGKLKSAVSQWHAMAQKLKRLADGGEGESAHDLERKATSADWEGINARITKGFVTRTAEQFGDAAVAASSVHDLLQDAHASFERHKSDLDAVVSTGRKKGLHISSTGLVSARDNADPKPVPKDVEETVADIERILGEAHDTDRIAADALRELSRNKYDFPSREATLESARKLDKRQAIADAQEAQGIVGQPGPLSEAQLAELDAIFARQADNSVFATRFFNAVGPSDTLRFNVELATQFTLDRDPQKIQQAAALQDNMGRALAAATRDVGAEGSLTRQWVADMKSAGQEHVYIEVGGGMGVSAYGYQSLGSLLESGRYSSEFLTSVAHDIIEVDKSLAGGWPDGGSFSDWTLDISDAVEGREEAGLDPIIGLMRAEAHTPQAALDLFSDEETFEYLLTSEFPSTERNALVGHALESAVYGYPFNDQPPVSPLHSPEQAELMKSVVELVSRDADVAVGHLGDNLGKMTAAYMPEVNRSLLDTEELRGLYPSGNDVVFGDQEVQRFMYALAQSPEAYADVVYGQHAYSAHMLEHHLGNPSQELSDKAVVQAVAQNGGVIQGIMAHSRADATLGSAAADASDYNASLDRQGNAFKTLASFGATVATAAYATGPYAIPVTGAGAVAAGGASMIIDEIMAGHKNDGSVMSEAYYRAGGDFEEAKRDTIHALDRSAWHAVQAHNVDMQEGDLELVVDTAVSNGFTWADSELGVYQNRPDKGVR